MRHAIYPRPSLDFMYRQSLQFVDPTPGTGYTFPGFEIEAPRLEQKPRGPR